MNEAATTTGLIPLTIGSMETFQLQAYKNRLPWDLTGGSAQLLLADPTGSLTTINATIVGQGAQANWTVGGLSGTWARAWKVTDSSGIVQISRPIAFAVISSPA